MLCSSSPTGSKQKDQQLQRSRSPKRQQIKTKESRPQNTLWLEVKKPPVAKKDKTRNNSRNKSLEEKKKLKSVTSQPLPRIVTFGTRCLPPTPKVLRSSFLLVRAFHRSINLDASNATCGHTLVLRPLLICRWSTLHAKKDIPCPMSGLMPSYLIKRMHATAATYCFQMGPAFFAATNVLLT